MGWLAFENLNWIPLTLLVPALVCGHAFAVYSKTANTNSLRDFCVSFHFHDFQSMDFRYKNGLWIILLERLSPIV